MRLVEIDDEIGRIGQQSPDAWASDEEFEAALRDLYAQRDSVMSDLSGGGVGDPPLSIDGPAPDDRVAIGGIVPISFSIERNSLRTADTATVTINHSDAPFDPRLIRAASIEIVFGMAPPSNWERGSMRGVRRTDGSRISLPERAGPATTRFVGVVDNWAVSYDGDDGDTIELTCRDLSALLFDEPLRQGTGIDLSLPIDRAISAFLDGYPSTRGTRVVWAGSGEAPTVGSATPARVTGTRGGRQRQVRSGDQRMNLWDHVTEVCARAGLVPIFVDYELRIVNPRTFYASGSRARRMVYGRNLLHLEFTRKIGGVQVPTIEVRSYDPTIGRTRWARYPVAEGQPASGIIGVSDPPRPGRPNVPLVSGHNPTERIATYLVDAVSDPATLQGVARSVFEQVGRQEIEGNCETDSPYTVDSLADDPDLLNVDSGSAIELLVTRAVHTSTVAEGLSATEIADLTREARVDYLERLGWTRRVAERFAELQESTAFQTIFRVQNARISFSNTDGLRIAIDFVNYITARDESRSDRQADQELGPGPSAEEQELRTRTDEPARAYQAALQDREALTTQRAAGAVTEQEYQERVADLDEVVAARRRSADEV